MPIEDFVIKQRYEVTTTVVKNMITDSMMVVAVNSISV